MKKVALLILDGWGIEKNKKISAINLAKTPNINFYIKKYPNSTLLTSGLNVGLPKNQMGNSEVGHINLGAGRIVYQNLEKINFDISNNIFFNKKILKNTLLLAKNQNKKIHLIGLVSNGGIHSHIHHLEKLIDVTQIFKLNQVYIHAFTDGRDSNPKSGKIFITQIINKIKNTPVKLATICGRYYAMDRDKRWDRIKIAYNALVKNIGIFSNDPVKLIDALYQKNITDEFIKPIIIIDNNNNPISKIENEDIVICFNFRTDRSRQITEVLSQRDFPKFKTAKLKLHYVTMTEYDKQFKNIQSIYSTNYIKNTLGETLAQANKTQIRIAETEKYPHVTFFFSGGNENKYPGEKRILCQSPKNVTTYDLKPEMAAFDITKNIILEINKTPADFICLNLANADMVGHTGNMQATIQACEVVDKCLNHIVNSLLFQNYTIFLLSDHGNADVMINNDGTPNTQHSTNPVPFIVIDKFQNYQVQNGILSDIAPSILKIMNINIPKEMTGNIIVKI